VLLGTVTFEKAGKDSVKGKRPRGFPLRYGLLTVACQSARDCF
jgi:hypothetical protein